MTERIIHDLAQGSEEWAQFRLTHFGASEAGAMLGVSTKIKRTELLHMKVVGTAKEFSEFVQTRILDKGHEVEAMARPLAEEMLGEELYPVTCSLGVLSASCDGLTMDERIAWEHKQWNDALAKSVAAGVLPEEYIPQPQQIMLVTGAEKVVFTVSDGTRENMVSMEVLPDPVWRDRILAGWSQFERDAEAYSPEVIEAKPVGRTPEALPALRIEVTGMVTASNLTEFRAHAMAVFGGINRELTTDQHFADAEKAVKWCGEVETRLEAAKQHALSQTESIDVLFKTIDDIAAEARSTRLALDKLVTKRKVEIKDEILLKAKRAYERHLAVLREETGGHLVSMSQPDFGAAAKGKRTVASIQDAVNTVLANAKIDADASARRVRENLACIATDGAGYAFLFNDTAALIAKHLDDLKLIVSTRIATHKAAEQKRLDDERERIRREEEDKARQKIAEEAGNARVSAEVTSGSTISTAAGVANQGVGTRSGFAETMAKTRSAPTSAPTLRLGQINERLAPVALSAEGLATLGFKPAATDKSAKLYHEEDFPKICAALIRHIETATISTHVALEHAA
ncbi:YqaJ viral recombinase family protein [Paraburkholderia sp.]|uniref:YqaJ viral recombinase family protein n=1 Tax=Paraburkholderia sp. TaxID=1926495 RepID=UPI0023976344|nr:YqaJ viral recombinase family protein [Paraburkholderia sp.]MDE1179453.1 YqaJ viral recombinase family protein [Paraburkholderia sp.]